MLYLPILLLLLFAVVVFLVVTKLLPVARLLFAAMTPDERVLALFLTAAAMVVTVLTVAAFKSFLYHS